MPDRSISLERTVEVRPAGPRRVAYVQIAGEVDLSNAEQLANTVHSPECAETDGLILDLQGVDFIDSTGLRVLLTIAAERQPAFATVIAPDSAISKLVDLIDVGKRVNAVLDEDEAMARIEAAHASS